MTVGSNCTVSCAACIGFGPGLGYIRQTPSFGSNWKDIGALTNIELKGVTEW